MKKQNIRDERVLMQRRKILSESYVILMIILSISVFIQQHLLNAPFEQYAAEVICFLGISLYMLIRYIMLGINDFGDKKSLKITILINSVVAGIVVTIINGILNYIKYGVHYKGKPGFFVAGLAIMFVSATIGTFVILLVLDFINNKRQEQIKKKLDKEEQDN